MSLKAFHLIFITAACALAVGCGVWGLRNGDMIFGIGSLVSAVGLIIYERYVLKKLKNVSYL